MNSASTTSKAAAIGAGRITPSSPPSPSPFLQLERARHDDTPRPTLPVLRFWVREIMGLLYVINSRRLLSMMVSFQRNPPLRR
jgi:hypothetical protein